MAAAYAYADGGHYSPELDLLSQIDRFGVQAVMGRTLGYLEIVRLRLAESVANAYFERAKSNNWDTWARTYPDKHRLLEKALVAAIEYGYIDVES